MTTDPDWPRLREIWRGMHKRCENPRCHDYPKYGAKGITVCREWDEFEPFFHWAKAHGYRSDYTLERVAVTRGYSPGNCRWISRKAQAYNRTTNTRYTIDGHTKTLAEWSKEYGVPAYAICHRLESGWSVEDAVKTPKRKYQKKG